MLPEGQLRKGAVVIDCRTEKVGEVMDHLDGRLYLRPPGGGIEWEAGAQDVRQAAPQEELRARVAEANAASRRWGAL